MKACTELIDAEKYPAKFLDWARLERQARVISAYETMLIPGLLQTEAYAYALYRALARAVVRTGAEVQGMLDQSRADQVAATNVKMHEDYEKAVNKRSGWIQFGAGVGVAAGVAFLPEVAAAGVAATLIGLGTDTGSGLVENVVGQFIGDLSDNSVDEHKEKMEQLTRDEKTKVYKGGESMAESPMENFLDRHTTDSDADKKFREDLRESMLVGYGVGNDRAQQQGSDPETGD
ncbi:Scr1 family TA system antitoxin-like transcriptional regulator [Streptomyces sp. NPDC057543]|uniref:Scr1 family TA system antitoxin-like transcriptional regulator n=1 Tax=Streptomyces sp. NPDC057543 TaxID=3346163 RepID=UPI003690A332